jgi:hypothetical protein
METGALVIRKWTRKLENIPSKNRNIYERFNQIQQRVHGNALKGSGESSERPDNGTGRAGRSGGTQQRGTLSANPGNDQRAEGNDGGFSHFATAAVQDPVTLSTLTVVWIWLL